MKRKVKHFEKKIEALPRVEKVIFYLVIFCLCLSVGMMIGFWVAKEKRNLLAERENELRIEVERRVLNKLQESREK